MKMVIALSAAALIAASPAVFAQGVSSKTPSLHHKSTKKPAPPAYSYAPWRKTQANGLKKGYRGAFGYAPSDPRNAEPRNYTIDNSRQAGGGGGGGGM